MFPIVRLAFTFGLEPDPSEPLASTDVPSTVADVEVDTQPDGTLIVRWAFEGEPVAVDVATGPSPDRVDHQHETTVAASQTTLRLVRRGGGRQFVSVAPRQGGPAVVAADRRVPFEGITNFRDLGGYGPVRVPASAGGWCSGPTPCTGFHPATWPSTTNSGWVPSTTCAATWNAPSAPTRFRLGLSPSSVVRPERTRRRTARDDHRRRGTDSA